MEAITNEYLEKLIRYFLNLPYGTSILISSIATDSERFITAVKQLMDEKIIEEIEFTTDYQYINKISIPFNYSVLVNIYKQKLTYKLSV